MIRISMLLSLLLISCTKDEGMTVEKIKTFLGKHEELQSQLGTCSEITGISKNTMQFTETEVILNVKDDSCSSSLKMKYELREPNILSMSKAQVVSDGCKKLTGVSPSYTNSYSVEIDNNNLKMTHLQSGECKVLKGI